MALINSDLSSRRPARKVLQKIGDSQQVTLEIMREIADK